MASDTNTTSFDPDLPSAHGVKPRFSATAADGTFKYTEMLAFIQALFAYMDVTRSRLGKDSNACLNLLGSWIMTTIPVHLRSRAEALFGRKDSLIKSAPQPMPQLNSLGQFELKSFDIKKGPPQLRLISASGQPVPDEPEEPQVPPRPDRPLPPTQEQLQDLTDVEQNALHANYDTQTKAYMAELEEWKAIKQELREDYKALETKRAAIMKDALIDMEPLLSWVQAVLIGNFLYRDPNSYENLRSWTRLGNDAPTAESQFNVLFESAFSRMTSTGITDPYRHAADLFLKGHSTKIFTEFREKYPEGSEYSLADAYLFVRQYQQRHEEVAAQQEVLIDAEFRIKLLCREERWDEVRRLMRLKKKATATSSASSATETPADAKPTCSFCGNKGHERSVCRQLQTAINNGQVPASYSGTKAQLKRSGAAPASAPTGGNADTAPNAQRRVKDAQGNMVPAPNVPASAMTQRPCAFCRALGYDVSDGSNASRHDAETCFKRMTREERQAYDQRRNQGTPQPTGDRQMQDLVKRKLDNKGSHPTYAAAASQSPSSTVGREVHIANQAAAANAVQALQTALSNALPVLAAASGNAASGTAHIEDWAKAVLSSVAPPSSSSAGAASASHYHYGNSALEILNDIGEQPTLSSHEDDQVDQPPLHGDVPDELAVGSEFLTEMGQLEQEAGGAALEEALDAFATRDSSNRARVDQHGPLLRAIGASFEKDKRCFAKCKICINCTDSKQKSACKLKSVLNKLKDLSAAKPDDGTVDTLIADLLNGVAAIKGLKLKPVDPDNDVDGAPRFYFEPSKRAAERTEDEDSSTGIAPAPGKAGSTAYTTVQPEAQLNNQPVPRGFPTDPVPATRAGVDIGPSARLAQAYATPYTASLTMRTKQHVVSVRDVLAGLEPRVAELQAISQQLCADFGVPPLRRESRSDSASQPPRDGNTTERTGPGTQPAVQVGTAAAATAVPIAPLNGPPVIVRIGPDTLWARTAQVDKNEVLSIFADDAQRFKWGPDRIVVIAVMCDLGCQTTMAPLHVLKATNQATRPSGISLRMINQDKSDQCDGAYDVPLYFPEVHAQVIFPYMLSTKKLSASVVIGCDFFAHAFASFIARADGLVDFSFAPTLEYDGPRMHLRATYAQRLSLLADQDDARINTVQAVRSLVRSAAAASAAAAPSPSPHQPAGQRATSSQSSASLPRNAAVLFSASDQPGPMLPRPSTWSIGSAASETAAGHTDPRAIIVQRLVQSGDVEVNPGPSDSLPLLTLVEAPPRIVDSKNPTSVDLARLYHRTAPTAGQADPRPLVIKHLVESGDVEVNPGPSTTPTPLAEAASNLIRGDAPFHTERALDWAPRPRPPPEDIYERDAHLARRLARAFTAAQAASPRDWSKLAATGQRGLFKGPKDRHGVHPTTLSLPTIMPQLQDDQPVYLFEPGGGGVLAGLSAALRAGATIDGVAAQDLVDFVSTAQRARMMELQTMYPQAFSAAALAVSLRVHESFPADMTDITIDMLVERGIGVTGQWLCVAGVDCRDSAVAQRNPTGIDGPRTGKALQGTKQLFGAICQLGAIHACPVAWVIEHTAGELHPKSDTIVRMFVERVRPILGMPLHVDAAQLGSRSHRLRAFYGNVCPPGVLQAVFAHLHPEPEDCTPLQEWLGPHLIAQQVTQSDAPPWFVANVVGQPRRALPTQVSTMGSGASRFKLSGQPGANMLFDPRGLLFGQPGPQIKAASLGYWPHEGPIPGLSTRQLLQIWGQSIDSNVLTAVLLSGRFYRRWLRDGTDPLTFPECSPGPCAPPTGEPTGNGGGEQLQAAPTATFLLKKLQEMTAAAAGTAARFRAKTPPVSATPTFGPPLAPAPAPLPVFAGAIKTLHRLKPPDRVAELALTAATLLLVTAFFCIITPSTRATEYHLPIDPLLTAHNLLSVDLPNCRFVHQTRGRSSPGSLPRHSRPPDDPQNPEAPPRFRPSAFFHSIAIEDLLDPCDDNEQQWPIIFKWPPDAPTPPESSLDAELNLNPKVPGTVASAFRALEPLLASLKHDDAASATSTTASSPPQSAHQWDVGDDDMDPAMRSAWYHMLDARREAFAASDEEVGMHNSYLIRIKLKPGTQPIRRKQFKRSKFEEEHSQLYWSAMIRTGKAEVNPDAKFLSPAFSVPKKDASGRYCTLRQVQDYRAVNEVCEDEFEETPTPPQLLARMSASNARYFSSIDLKQAYRQLLIHPDDRHILAFWAGPDLGVVQPTSAPMGWKNSAQHLQRAVKRLFEDMPFVAWWADDVDIYSATPEEHLDHVTRVLDALIRCGMKADLLKCHFCKRTIDFIGYVLSADGVRPAKSKVEALAKLPAPRNVAELRSQLGGINFYRRHIKDLGRLQACLNELLQKDVPWEWTPTRHAAWQEIKRRLTEAPVLVHPDWSKIFHLCTDFSNQGGLGAVLSQVGEDGLEHPIAFASRSLNRAERNYSSVEGECLAAKWGVLQFHYYLFGRRFRLFTDSSALSWLMRTQNLTGKLLRTATELSLYDFEVCWRPGTENGNADLLSRHMPTDEERDTGPETPIAAAAATAMLPSPGAHMARILARCQELMDYPPASADLMDLAAAALDAAAEDEGTATLVELPTLSPASPSSQPTGTQTLARSREGHPDIWFDEPAMAFLTQRTVPSSQQEIRRLLRRLSHYHWSPPVQLPDGTARPATLYRRTRDGLRVVPPPAARADIIQRAHDNLGHFGQRRTAYLVAREHWWHGLLRDTEDVVRRCERCSRIQATFDQADTPRLQSLPLEGIGFRIHVDTAGPFPITARGSVYVVVILDAFSKWVEAYAIPDKTAAATTRCLRDFVARFGAPAQCVIDSGSEYQAEFERAAREFMVDVRRISRMHPQSNGAAEKCVQTFKCALKAYCEDPEHQKDWDDRLYNILAGYRWSRQASTGFSPYFLLFQRDAILPAHVRDLLDDAIDVDDPAHALRVIAHRARVLQDVMPVALANMRAAQHRDALRYETTHARSIRNALLRFQPGQYVYYRRRARNALEPEASRTILRVREVRNDGSALLEGSDASTITVHVRNLAPCMLPNVNPGVHPRLWVPRASLSCRVCNLPSDEDQMVLCDTCNDAYHVWCMDPPLESVPLHAWHCRTHAATPSSSSAAAAARTATTPTSDGTPPSFRLPATAFLHYYPAPDASAASALGGGGASV